MSAMACEMIGTGDGKLEKRGISDEIASKDIAMDIVLEIVDNALDIGDKANKESMELKEKHKDKPATPLTGTGDQRSSEVLEEQEPVFLHPRVEKKNRLTDLVKNSKQVLAKIMLSDSKADLREEKLVEVIDLECTKDSPFKSRCKVLPSEVPLPDDDSTNIFTPPSEEHMDEVKLSTPPKENYPEKTRMTLPRATGSRAKAAFVAKCRTLKKEATNLKKKRWDVRGKIAKFFRKKRDHEDGGGSNCQHAKTQCDLEDEVVQCRRR